MPENPAPARDLIGYGRFPPRVRWPGDARLVISVVLNYEAGAEYTLDEDGRNDSWGESSSEVPPPVRDLGTESHYEFGSRAGVWRLVRLFDERKIPVSVGACAVALARNPELAEWIRASGNEAVAHGYRWTENWTLTREQERSHLLRAVEVFEEMIGEHPLGWYTRTFPSVHTRQLLVEEGGFLYDSDSCNDELPYYVEVGGRDFLVVPYSKVYNDTRYLMAPSYATPRHLFESLRDGADYLCEEAEAGEPPKMMTIGVHERWSGQASRASALRDFFDWAGEHPGIRFMRRGEIARWWDEHHGEWEGGAPR